tara:strand:+ start:231 stop:464 length:234 start_codon:yes stop_codon:yes gene_type:complete
MIKTLKALEFKQTKLNYFFVIKSKKNTYTPFYNKVLKEWRCDCFFKSNMGFNKKDTDCKHITLCKEIIKILTEEIKE